MRRVCIFGRRGRADRENAVWLVEEKALYFVERGVWMSGGLSGVEVGMMEEEMAVRAMRTERMRMREMGILRLKRISVGERETW
jgi:hypothetical protein